MEIKLPEHKASLHITHNQHKSYYMTIEEYIAEEDISVDEWANSKSKNNAIKTDSIWELQWYPNTPVGFNVIYGATLEEILLKANQ